MEARLCLIYAVVNCVVIQYLESKPFSLNEAIAAEAQYKHDSETTSVPIFEDTAGERFSLNRVLTSPIKTRKLEKTGNIFPRNKKLSPLKYRKTFQIKSPLKPKKLKYSPRTRHIRKNQSFKREINENDIFNQKYIPLLRSVGMLFDNLLGPDASDSYEENKQYKNKRTRYYSGERDGEECTCVLASQFTSNNEKSREETDTLTTSPTTEITTTTEIPTKIAIATATTDNIAFSNISSLRYDTDLPLLFSRNTVSGRRDDNGFSAGSSTAHNGSIERYISRDNGNREYISGNGKDKSYTEGDETNTDGDTRDSTSGSGARKRLREYRSDTGESKDTIGFEINTTENKAIKGSRGDSNEFQGQNQLEMDRDQTKSTELVSEPVRRLRGATVKTENETIAEVPTTVSKESIPDVTLNSTSFKRVVNRGSTLATENKEIHPRHEAITSLKEPKMSDNSKTNTPVVVIIDGYSVTRNRNGEKKLARKAIHINPK